MPSSQMVTSAHEPLSKVDLSPTCGDQFANNGGPDGIVPSSTGSMDTGRRTGAHDSAAWLGIDDRDSELTCDWWMICEFLQP
jgi:hypothetical protein